MSKYYTIYSGSSLNQLVTQMGIENSATTFHYDFPKNITRYDKTYKVTITNNNDPNCIKSGETLVTVPYEDECFCTCDNISLFYREMKTNFPMMFDGGKQRYEVASGNTQGCGILSANTAESDMFENQEIEVVKDGDDYHFYATVLDHPEGYTGGQRTAGVVVYFIPTSEISGDPQWDTACQQTFTCIQNSDTLNMLTCDFFSGLTFSSMPQTGSYTGMVISAFFDNVPQNPYYNGPAFIEFNVSNDKGLSLTRCGVQTYVYSGGHHSAFSLFNIPLNTLHSTILWTITANVCLDGELEVIGSDDPNYDTYDKMNIRNKMKRGYPCGKITLRTLQEGLPPCTCEEIPSAQTETHSWNSRSYYARGEITRVVPASQETCYSAMSVTEISGDCAWINDVYVSGPSFVHYYLPDYPNNDSEDWECVYEVFYKNLEGGEDCTGTLTFIKEHNPNPPEECTCDDIVNAVYRPSTISASGGNLSCYVSNVRCSDLIQSVNFPSEASLWWEIDEVGSKTYRLHIYPNESTDSRSDNITGTVTTTNGETCNIRWDFTQYGACGCSVAKIYRYNSETITRPIEFHYVGQTAYGKFSRACTVTLNSKPNWIDVNVNGESWDVEINSNAGTSTGLTGTITFNVDGVLCNNLDLQVSYDYECNCDYSVSPSISQQTVTIPNTGGTNILVGIYNNYASEILLHPCLEARATSTSAYISNIRIDDSNGAIYCDCAPNSGAEARPHIDINIFMDNGTNCNKNTYIELILQAG